MQSYNLPFKISDINLENLVYKEVKSNSKKTVVFLKYKKKNSLKNLVIQSPTFLNINNPVKNKNHWDLDVPLHGKKNDKINNFVRFLRNLDNKIVYDATINSAKWFENFDTEEINYQQIIRTAEDNRFSNGMIRLKILKNNDFQTMLQINNKESINVEDIPQNSWIKMIIEIQAIWINKNGFGLFLKPILISFTPIEIKRYKFIEESEDEVDDVLDSENGIFLKSNKSYVNDLETSNLKLDNINDSLEVDSKTRFSSTSSNNKASSTSSENSEKEKNQTKEKNSPKENLNLNV
tara:strand:+ start:2708 stop:3586 length:879 start_codon:yes stop_codon:yes gene_type:complete